MAEADFTLRYPLAAEPEDAGGHLEITPGVFWLRVPLPGRLRHINLWLLEDGDHWTLVDTGLKLDGVQQAWERLAAGLLQDKPVARIIVTHYHPDHVGMAGLLADRFQARLYMTATTARRARFLLDSDMEDWRAAIDDFCALHGIPCAERYAEFITGQRFRQVVARLPDDIAVLDHEPPLAVGAHEWLPMVARGHAEDHLSLFCPNLNLLIAGDQVLPTITSNVAVHFNNAAEDALAEYLESMERFAALPRETLVLPSHGQVFANLHNRIAAIRHSHARQSDKAASLCAAPAAAWPLSEQLFARPLDEFNRILAFGETLAHLAYLHNRGELARELVEGQYRYVRTP